MEKMINEKIQIEELVEILPASVSYLAKKGIKCIACGEPIWGTLEEAAKGKGFGDRDIHEFVMELENMYDKERK